MVRVGTHALTATSRTTLWGRLRQHRGRLGGRNPGGGNHRASIFRAARRRRVNPLRTTGRRGCFSPGRAHAASRWVGLEEQVERRVSDHIRTMPFLWLAVPDRPEGGSNRGYIEKNSIALLSCRAGGPDRPSAGWLGRHASSEKVRQSALWNSNHVDDHYDPGFLPVLAGLVERVQ